MATRPRLRIQPLGSHHDRAAFSCGSEPLDRYLRQQAGQDVRKHAAANFVLVREGSPAVLGFYTLSATSLRFSDLPERTARKLPRYPDVPALLLGRLAVDRGQAGQGFGKILLMDALKRCLTLQDIGWALLVVDAKDDSAMAFYERYHLTRMSPMSRRLFLTRDTVAALVEGT